MMEAPMKTFYFAASLLMASTAAHAGNGISFQIDGRKVHIEAPKNCSSLDCIQVNGSSLNLKNLKSRIADDDDMITGLQRFASDALAAQLSATAPFDSVADGFALLILAFHMDERMRVPEQELNQIALDCLLLVFEVGGGEGMMSIKLNTRHQRRCGHQ